MAECMGLTILIPPDIYAQYFSLVELTMEIPFQNTRNFFNNISGKQTI